MDTRGHASRTHQHQWGGTVLVLVISLAVATTPRIAPAAPTCHPNCGGNQPPVVDVTGAYTGQSSGGGPFTFSLTQTGTTVTGTLNVANNKCFSRLQFSGVVTGNTICGASTDSRTCLDLQGTVSASGNEIDGSYSIEAGASECKGDSGSFSMTRTTPLPVRTPTPTPPMPSPTPTTASGVCTGDCRGTHTVDVTSLILLVNIALGSADPSACAQGIPADTTVDVVLIVRAVNNALNGCPGAG